MLQITQSVILSPLNQNATQTLDFFPSEQQTWYNSLLCFKWAKIDEIPHCAPDIKFSPVKVILIGHLVPFEPKCYTVVRVFSLSQFECFQPPLGFWVTGLWPIQPSSSYFRSCAITMYLYFESICIYERLTDVLDLKWLTDVVAISKIQPLGGLTRELVTYHC